MNQELNLYKNLVGIDGNFHIILHHLTGEYNFDLRGKSRRHFYIDTMMEEVIGTNDMESSMMLSNPIELLKRYPGIINKKEYLPEYFHPTLEVINKFNLQSTNRYFLLFYEPKWGWFLAQVNLDHPNRTIDCDIVKEISKVLSEEEYSIGLFNFSINSSEDEVYPVIRFDLPIDSDSTYYARDQIRKQSIQSGSSESF